MNKVKRFAPLVVSVMLILTLGGISIAVSASANRKARDVHTADRQKLNETLAGLTDQYILFSFKEVMDTAKGTEWTLQPGDPRDAQRLQGFIERSTLLNHGAALLGVDGEPLNAFAKPPGLPALDEPGLAPLREALSAGRPGLSSLMSMDGVPVVGLAVPVIVDDVPRALLVAFFRADTGPLQVYSERLDHGPNGIGYVLDSQGSVVAATEPGEVGKQIQGNPGVEAMLAGRSGFMEYDADGTRMTAVYHQLGMGGWGDIVLQPAEDFFGPITEGGRHVFFAVLILLVAAAFAIAVLNFLRERALRAAYDYKGQLLANSTHELKTPLTAIRGAAITLGTRWRDMHPESVDQLLGMIHRRTDGLGKLADRILMGARLDAGCELTMTPVKLEVAGTLRRLATEFADVSQRHTFTVTTSDDLVARVDSEAFDQVVGMLLENAIKYSPDGGEIKLKAAAVRDDVVVRVEDRGVGIPEEARDHIFEPYFRVHRGDTQAYGGVGLGLSICRHLVRLNGGDIAVSSKLGVGTAFTFTVPKVDFPARRPARTEAVQGWITVKDAAASAGVHPSTVRSWLREGRVRSERVEMNGRPRRLVAVEDLQAKSRRRRASATR